MLAMQQLNPTQYQQQYQPITQQYIPPKSYEEIVTDISSCATKDSIEYQLVSQLSSQLGYPLELDSLFWNKYSKLRIKPWGGAVTDQTILINNKRMPIIRKSNYSESTWNVSIDSIPITIGNETISNNNNNKQVISLRQYLSNINQYITSKDNNNIKEEENKEEESIIRKVSLLSSNDNFVIMNTQYCLLPLNPMGNTQFTIGTLNWKSGLKNPSCLYIISTNNGTSSVVIEGNFQKIYYNKNGQKSLFNINNNTNENDCLITIIQVPLKQKTRKQIEEEQTLNAKWGITNWWSNNNEKQKRIFDILPTNCVDPKVQSLLKQYGYHQTIQQQNEGPKISRSGIKIIPNIVPTYCCTRPLTKCEAETCYGEKNANITVSCDGCGGSFSGQDIIWHCPATIKDLHPNGYDLCDSCAQKQLIFDELRGLKGLKRDERYNIRVTLLYYKPIINGIINENIITQIIQKLIKSHNLGRITQTQTQPISNISNIQKPIVPKQIIKSIDYKIISNALNELKLNKEFVKIFQNQNVTDSDLKLLNDNDLNLLFPNALGPKIRFRQWLKENKNKLLKGKNNIIIDQNQYRIINNIFRQINVLNPQKYILNFVNNNINDKLIGMLNDSDLEKLIPDMSIRIMFRNRINNTQQTNKIQSQIGTSIQTQHSSQPFLY